MLLNNLLLDPCIHEAEVRVCQPVHQPFPSLRPAEEKTRTPPDTHGADERELVRHGHDAEVDELRGHEDEVPPQERWDERLPRSVSCIEQEEYETAYRVHPRLDLLGTVPLERRKRDEEPRGRHCLLVNGHRTPHSKEKTHMARTRPDRAQPSPPSPHARSESAGAAARHTSGTRRVRAARRPRTPDALCVQTARPPFSIIKTRAGKEARTSCAAPLRSTACCASTSPVPERTAVVAHCASSGRRWRSALCTRERG
jgi:hypothetical protein